MKQTQARRVIGTLFVAATFFVPLVYLSDIQEQTELPKRALAGLFGAVLLLLHALTSRPLRLWMPLPAILLLALGAWQIAIAGFAYAPALAVEVILVTLESLVWLLAACVVLEDPRWRLPVLVAGLGAATVAATVGLLQYAVEHPGAFPLGDAEVVRAFAEGRLAGGVFSDVLQTDAPGAVFAHTNLAAQFSGLWLWPVIVLLVGLWRRTDPVGTGQRLVGTALLAVPAAILALFLVRTGSRGAQLAFATTVALGWVGFVVASCRHRPLLGSRAAHLAIHALALAVLAIGAGVVLDNVKVSPRHGQEETTALARLTSALDSENTTVRERRDLWSNTVAMIEANPVFGVGPGNFRVAYPEYAFSRARHESGRFGLGRQPEKPHNEYLHALADNGVVGGALWILAVLSAVGLGLLALARAPVGRRAVLAGAVLAMILLLGAAAVSFPFLASANRTTFWTCAALVATASRRPGATGREWGAPGRVILVGGCVVLIAVLATHYRARISASRAVWEAGVLREASRVRTGDGNRYLLDELRRLDAAVMRVPRSYTYEYYRAEVLRRLGRLTEAARSYERTLAIHPNLVNAFIGLSATRLLSGDARGAQELAEKAVRLNPEEGEAHLALASVLDHRGRRRPALKSYAAALERDLDRPGRARAHVNVSLLMNDAGNAVGAWQHILRAEELLPGDRDVLEAKARVLERLSPGSPKALEAWARLLLVNPRHAEALMRVGLSALKEKHWEDALRYFEDAYSVNRFLRSSLYHRAEALFQLGRLREARDSLLECMKECAKYGEVDLWERCATLVAQIEEEHRKRTGGAAEKDDG